jgi:hypothetical protein
VKFINLPWAVMEKVDWIDASPDGPIAEKIGDYEKDNLEEERETITSLKEYRDQLRAKDPVRRTLLRQLQTTLRTTKTAGDATAALNVLLPKLYGTILDPEAGYPDENLETIIRSELRVIYERFGPNGLAQALELPQSSPAKLKDSLQHYVSFELREALAVAEAEQWVKSNFPDLPAELASWKKAPKSAPAAARDAFLQMLQTLSSRSVAGSPDKARTALRNLALDQLPAFAADYGPAALDQLLRSLAQTPTDLVTVAHVSATLSPEQKFALIQLWKTQ